MFEMVKKFFDFCSKQNRRKFYVSVFLGVLDAMFGAMKIPAAFFAIKSVLDGDINKYSFIIVINLMLVSTIGKMVVNRFAQMLQTEAGYDTCANKRIEIGEHLRYLPMGYFNDTSLGHITSVTTNTLEQMSDIATRAIMLVLQGSITTIVIGIGMFAFDYRIGIFAVIGILVFFGVNKLTTTSVARVADDKLASDKDMVGVILEFIQGISEIRNYNLIKQNNTRIKNAIELKSKNDIRAEIAAIPAVGVQMLVCTERWNSPIRLP